MLWDSRNKARLDAAASAAAPRDDGQQIPTKALRKFVASLISRESPVLLDLGPVVGPNVTFFGERLGCKILLEDVFADLERYLRTPSETPFAEVLKSRLKHEPASIDGILCWNFFDYIDPAAAQVLASSLTRLLRPDGAILAFFSSVGVNDGRFYKYVIADEDSLTQKPYSSSRRQTAMPNRDIIRMFEGLKVAESFLLKTNIREFLFRKPAKTS